MFILYWSFSYLLSTHPPQFWKRLAFLSAIPFPRQWFVSFYLVSAYSSSYELYTLSLFLAEPLVNTRNSRDQANVLILATGVLIRMMAVTLVAWMKAGFFWTPSRLTNICLEGSCVTEGTEWLPFRVFCMLIPLPGRGSRADSYSGFVRTIIIPEEPTHCRNFRLG